MRLGADLQHRVDAAEVGEERLLAEDVLLEEEVDEAVDVVDGERFAGAVL